MRTNNPLGRADTASTATPLPGGRIHTANAIAEEGRQPPLSCIGSGISPDCDADERSEARPRPARNTSRRRDPRTLGSDTGSYGFRPAAESKRWLQGDRLAAACRRLSEAMAA